MTTGVEQLQAAVDALLEADLSCLAGADVVELARRLETGRRRLAAVDHRVVAELEARRLAGEYGRSSTADLLVSELRVTPGEARLRAAQAQDLGPRSTLTGEQLPPLLAHCANASRAGSISTGHVGVISDCLDRAPSWLDSDAMQTVEAMLVDFAGHEHPGQLRRTGELLLARLDPDGPEPREVQRRRGVSLTRHRNGSGRLIGRLTAEATAVWDTILDTLGAPVPSRDGRADDRCGSQRAHDGFVEAGMRLLRSGELPPAGGVPVTILVRTTAADLAAATTPQTAVGDPSAGACRSDVGQTIAGSVSEDRPTAAGIGLTTRGDVLSLRSLLAAGDAEIIPVLVGEAGDVLRLGRTRRLGNRPQRLALTARDGGCCFPGCDRPASWTEVHHIREWRDGGLTDVDNLCLLCRFHHREFRARGWQVRMTDGVPEWLPPPWLDPERRPRRNRTHHPPELRFGPVRTCAA